MPRTKKNTKKHVLARNWKILFCLVVGVALVLAVAAQVTFNKFVWDSLQQQSAFDMKTLVADAIRGLEATMSSPDSQQRIAEVQLALPKTSTQQHIRYRYTEPMDGNKASLDVTSKELMLWGVGQLPGRDQDELWGAIPEAQACSRGFSIYFHDAAEQQDKNQVTLAGTKRLADGRTMYVWRETGCNDKENMDKLESYLLKTQSY